MMGVGGLRIGRRVIVGGATITCRSRSCSSACCTGERLSLSSSRLLVMSNFMFVLLTKSCEGTLIVPLNVRVSWSYRSGLW